MPSPDRESRRHVEQEKEFAKLMDSFLADRVMLLDEVGRKKLQGTQTTINHWKDTAHESGIIQDADFTILDGTVFMWDNRRIAAIACGQMKEQKDLVIRGAVFSPRALRNTGIDPSEVSFFPDLLSEVPGPLEQFEDSLGFQITFKRFNRYTITVGRGPQQTSFSTGLFSRDKVSQVMQVLNRAVRTTVPRM